MAKRSISIAGHRTSISLEEPFWHALRAVAAERRSSINRLIAAIDGERSTEHPGNLSSAIRLFVLDCYRRGELPADLSPPR